MGRNKMGFKGPNAYDQKDFLEAYLSRRNRKESPNNAIEKPILLELLGDCTGMRILDLGCGDGAFGKQLLESGAESYTGIEGSLQMAALAEEKLASAGGKVIRSNIEGFRYPTETYDVVISRFVIHYIANIEPLFKAMYQTLRPGGRFILTVQHPLTTSAFNSKGGSDRRADWRVDQYFNEGERLEPWINKTVVKHHRTTESYFTALAAAGFSVKALREGMPVRGNFRNDEEFRRRQRIPLMLIFAALKEE